MQTKEEKIEVDQENLKRGNMAKVSLGLVILGIIGSVVALFTDRQQFYFAYLNAFFLFLAIGLGSLFFTMLQHIVSAEWSVVVRRITEASMMTIPFMFVLILPILLFGMHDLYHWTHEDVVASDPILKHKSVWLNTTFFSVRIVIYFTIWSVLAILLYRTSKKQDDLGTQELTEKLKKLSAPGILLFALTVSFAGWDLIMSLDPHWFSTMFGVYTFAGSWWASLAFLNLSSQYIRKQGGLEKVITIEHFHDMGKLMFGFTVFWAYIAFSQFMLIWYANIPEETAWFRHRWEHGWSTVSVLLILGHFVFPFLILIFRSSKRSLLVMKVMGWWFIVVQWLDYFWLIAPTKPGETHGLSELSWIHVVTIFFVGGVFLFLFWNRLLSANIIPIGDPKLRSSINFVNQ